MRYVLFDGKNVTVITAHTQEEFQAKVKNWLAKIYQKVEGFPRVRNVYVEDEYENGWKQFFSY